MRTTSLNSKPARACMILSLLICVRTLPAANTARPQASLQERVWVHTQAGPSDPCSVGPKMPTGNAVRPSDTAIPLAAFLSQTKNQLQSSSSKAGSSGALPEELWDSRISVPDADVEAESSLALRRLIRQVRSVKFAAHEQTPTFTPPADSPIEPKLPEKPLVQTGQAQPAATAKDAGAPDSSAPLSFKTRKTLDTLEQNPGQMHDPLEIAELLFLSGRLAEAAPFYAKAIDKISRIDPSYDADRAWILFQLGNCLRETDIAKAQEVYMKLVSEYPSSPWTELAKAHGRLLTWYQKSRTDRQSASSQL